MTIKRVRRFLGDTCWKICLDREKWDPVMSRTKRQELTKKLAMEEIGGRILHFGVIGCGIRIMFSCIWAGIFLYVSLGW